MDLTTIVYLVMLAFGGVAYDAYEHPKSMVVQVVTPGSNTVPSVDRAFVSTVVQSELNRVSKIRSLIARPEIRPSDDKTTIEEIADAFGGAGLVTAFSSVVGKPPSTLTVGLFNDGDKPAMLVSGTQRTIPANAANFDTVLHQQQGEAVIHLIKRASVDGAARIDPYLAMMYLLSEAHRTKDDQFAVHALQIEQQVTERAPSGHSLLLGRLDNLEGLIALDRGDLAAAKVAFLKALDRFPSGPGVPARIVVHLNLAFMEVAEGAPQSASDRIAALLEPGGPLDGVRKISTVTTEGTELQLGDDAMSFLRSTAYMIGGCAALALNDADKAERMARQSVAIDPMRITALALLADIATRRGDLGTAATLTASIHDLQFTADPYLETANAYATLSFADGTVKLAPSLYYFR